MGGYFAHRSVFFLYHLKVTKYIHIFFINKRKLLKMLTILIIRKWLTCGGPFCPSFLCYKCEMLLASSLSVAAEPEVDSVEHTR